ncbi:MAG: DUF1574 domain-containing protein [Candidatus Omnitrophica bacterium]|nr:DUF1574 domain-containing protein [Candidatus Omnitrophota bacterium]
MRRNTFISSFRKAPAGFLILLFLFILTEGWVFSKHADLINDYWNKFIINEHTLLELPKDYNYVMIGDSLQKTGIRPLLVSNELLNLGLPGAKPLGQYLLLKRYLARHKPPKVVFLYIDPENERDSLFVILRYFVTPAEFLSVWQDLAWRERQVFFLRYWATLDLRKVGLVKRDIYPYSNKDYIDTMIENHGFMPSPRTGKAISNDYFTTTKDRYQDKISIKERDMKYLDKLMKLADANNIRVVFLGHLLPEELYSMLKESGFNEDYMRFFDSLKLRYPGASFAGEPFFRLDNKYFGDMSHLNKEGVIKYTEYFKDKVFIPHSEGGGY